jgi:hypothetical protein
MTYGFNHWTKDDILVSHTPPHEPWCCRMHSRSTDRYAKKRWPEYFAD